MVLEKKVHDSYVEARRYGLESEKILYLKEEQIHYKPKGIAPI